MTTKTSIRQGGTGKGTASEAIDALGGASSTGTGGLVRAISSTLTTPNIGVATATSLATSAASPLLLTNGQLVNITLTSQTVGATTLTLPNFAGVADEFTFKTKAQTLSNKTFIAPALGTPISGDLSNCTGIGSAFPYSSYNTSSIVNGSSYGRVPVKTGTSSLTDMIIQYGSYGTGSTGTITFPLAFPTACVSVVLTSTNGTSSDNVTAKSTTAFDWANGGSITPNGYWIAIGY